MFITRFVGLTLGFLCGTLPINGLYGPIMLGIVHVNTSGRLSVLVPVLSNCHLRRRVILTNEAVFRRQP
jgi:hypothetical protein